MICSLVVGIEYLLAKGETLLLTVHISFTPNHICKLCTSDLSIGPVACVDVQGFFFLLLLIVLFCDCVISVVLIMGLCK